MSVNYSEYFPFGQYYRKYIMPKVKRARVSSSTKFICALPNHEDTDPSLSILKQDGHELIKCFGCGFTGNIIKFHKTFVLQKEQRYLSTEDAIKEIASIFNIDYRIIPKESEQVGVDSDKIDYEIMKRTEKFDISDYRYKLIEGKSRGEGIVYYNTLMMIMLNEFKNG